MERFSVGDSMEMVRVVAGAPAGAGASVRGAVVSLVVMGAKAAAGGAAVGAEVVSFVLSSGRAGRSTISRGGAFRATGEVGSWSTSSSLVSSGNVAGFAEAPGDWILSEASGGGATVGASLGLDSMACRSFARLSAAILCSSAALFSSARLLSSERLRSSSRCRSSAARLRSSRICCSARFRSSAARSSARLRSSFSARKASFWRSSSRSNSRLNCSSCLASCFCSSFCGGSDTPISKVSIRRMGHLVVAHLILSSN